jgi:hypothetical protein
MRPKAMGDFHMTSVFLFYILLKYYQNKSCMLCDVLYQTQFKNLNVLFLLLLSFMFVHPSCYSWLGN